MFDLTLTFDNGPEPEITPGVLDVLGRENISGTFFVLGDKIAEPARRRLARPPIKLAADAPLRRLTPQAVKRLDAEELQRSEASKARALHR